MEKNQPERMLTAGKMPISRMLSGPRVNADHSSWLCASCVPDFRLVHSQGGTPIQQRNSSPKA
jgi:hypothetical protein